jgi:hypothetical protein
MYCDSCGTQIEAGHGFCSKCGKAILGAQPMVNRVAKHSQMLGILWIAYSVLTTLIGCFLIFFFQHFVPVMLRYQPPQHQGPPPEVVFGMLRPLLHFVAILLLAKGIAGLFAGIGMLQHAAWSRMLTLIVGVISLLSFPFGTALGVYSLWVLLSPGAELEFQHA